MQRSGDRVRITAQLIYGPSDKHLWANSYERDMRDLFALERDVADEISRQVRARLATSNQVPLTQSRPTNPKALDAYLQGNYHLDQLGTGAGRRKKARPRSTSSKPLMPTPASHLRTWAWPMPSAVSCGPQVKMQKWLPEAAEHAVELDPTSSDAWCDPGRVSKSTGPGTGPGAEEELRRAIALNPNNATHTTASASFSMPWDGWTKVGENIKLHRNSTPTVTICQTLWTIEDSTTVQIAMAPDPDGQTLSG